MSMMIRSRSPRICPTAHRCFFILLVLVECALPQVCAILPAGFVDEGVARINSVVDLTFADTNNMLAVTKTGVLYRIDMTDPDAKKQEVLDISERICDNGERGLGTVLAHPNFAADNRWVYLFYTYNRGDTSCLLDATDGPINRCSRFVMNDDWTIDPESELILFQTSALQDKVHNGGDMEFGVDGMLYVMTGDAGARSLKWAQRRDNLFGNVLRITESGDIPTDNPYQGEGTARCNENGQTGDENVICQEIFAYGLRNPFRFTMDPYSTDKVRYLISDVGGAVWEEVNIGGTEYSGVNYGWPFQEGPCAYDSVSSCSAVADDNTGLHDPMYWYQHDEEESGCALGIAIPPPGLNWPEKYTDPSSFFFVDFVWGDFYFITPDSSQFCAECVPPTPAYRNETFHQWPRPVGLKFGPLPNGNADSYGLYYTVREGDLNIRRIVYNGGENYSPTVVFTVDKTNAPVGETFEFDASTTTDPNHAADELTYTWDFGDGSSEESGIQVTHEYDDVGVYEVTMTAVDPEGFSGQMMVKVSVGPEPTVEIVSPEEGSTFSVGDIFTLIGKGTDSSGNALDESTQLTFEVKQHHGNHYHPFLEPTIGNNIVITEAPEPEDFFAATNSYLEILLTGTDDQGIPATVSRKVMPRTVTLKFDTDPTGLTLSIDEEVFTMPQSVLTWESHNLRLVIPEQDGYVFTGWANGVEVSEESTILVPPNSTNIPKYVAIFEKVPDVESPETEEPTFSPIETPSDPVVASDDTESGDVVLGDDASSSRAAFSSFFILLLSLSMVRFGQ